MPKKKVSKKEREYYIEWHIELSAASREEAAKLARKIQLDPDSTATVFHVIEHEDQDSELDEIDVAEL